MADSSGLPRGATLASTRWPSRRKLRPSEDTRFRRRLGQLAHALQERFLGKEEVIRLLVVAAIAGEHAVLIGPPGTAKSALIRTFARLMQAQYFEYLLTRFTEPNEIFGPVDIGAFREGRYERRTEGMLPEAEIVFLDEVFKSNSAILNALLTLLNERRYASGGTAMRCPLISAFGASNEVPGDETLTAIYDRFILRIRNDNLDAYHFQELLQKGIDHEILHMTDAALPPMVSARELAELQRGLLQRPQVGEEVFSAVQGHRVPDPRRGGHAERPARREAPQAVRRERLPRRAGDAGRERSVRLEATWNSEDQAQILDGILTPVLEAHYRERPNARRVGAVGVGVESLAAEIERVRQVLSGAGGLSDVQLFSQLRALNEIKSALTASPDPRAKELLQRVDQLLEAAFRSGRFAQI